MSIENIKKQLKFIFSSEIETPACPLCEDKGQVYCLDADGYEHCWNCNGKPFREVLEEDYKSLGIELKKEKDL